MEGLMQITLTTGGKDITYFTSHLLIGTNLGDNGKIQKALNINYVACSNLIVYSDIPTGFTCEICGDLLYLGTSHENLTVSPLLCIKYPYAAKFSKYITRESYKHISNLCSTLLNEYKPEGINE